jgi:lipopolysaccharide transport system permease protein
MWHNLKLLFKHRELIWIWARRSIVGQYRQSVLGVGWAILPAFIQMVLFSIIFGGLLAIDTGDDPYPVFSYVALVPWTLFSRGITNSAKSIEGAKALVSKIYFPREVLIIAQLLSGLVDFLASMVIVFVLMLVFGVPFQITLLAVPVLLAIQLLLMLGISLFMATITVFFRDISFVIGFILQAWMYLTPIIYALDTLPEKLRPFMMTLNPMAGLIDGYRQAILHGAWPDPALLALTTAIALLLCITGLNYFKNRERLFADIM